jgi:AcrR family transcriptional regulator
MDEDSNIGVPAGIAAAWGRRPRPRKGPKPELTLERIVAAAVSVAASDGLDAVSMSRVAGDLGASAMSLYRYVAAKDELLSLMVDAVYGAPPDAPGDGESWRDGLERWAWAEHIGLSEHPWVLRIPIVGAPTLPNELAWFERGLACLTDTGLSETDKASVVLLISNFVRSDVTLFAAVHGAFEASGVSPQEAMTAYGNLILELTEPEQFPHVRGLIAAGVFEQDDPPDYEFVFGLERVLDGVAVLIERT